MKATMINDKDYKKLLTRTLPFLRHVFKNGGIKGMENAGDLIDKIDFALNQKSTLDEVRGVVNETQELNMLNYNEDEVRNLNDAMIRIFRIIQ